MNKLAPYGMDNPKPKVLIKEVNIESIRKIGSEQNHLKLILEHGWDIFRWGRIWTRECSVTIFHLFLKYLSLGNYRLTNGIIEKTTNISYKILRFPLGSCLIIVVSKKLIQIANEVPVEQD